MADSDFRVKNGLVVDNGSVTLSNTVSTSVTVGSVSMNSSGIFVGAGVFINTTAVSVGDSVINSSGASLSSSLFGGQEPSYYTNATNLSTGTIPYARIPANVINTTAAFTRSGVTTFNGNIAFGAAAGIIANGAIGTAGQVLASNASSVYWWTPSVVAGSNTQVQFNDSGALGAVSGFTFNKGTNVLTANGLIIGSSSFSPTNLTVAGQITANGTTGTAGYMLQTGGASANVFWAPVPATGVTSVATANGLQGGTITNTGTLSVLANTGIVANTTGTYVNASYIATISSNNASFLGGTAAASYALKADVTYIGTTSIALNRSSNTQTLTGVSIDGNAATVTNGLTTNNYNSYAVPLSGGSMSGRLLAQSSMTGGSLLNATGSLGGIEVQGPGGANAAFIAFQRPGSYGSYFGIDTDNQFAIGGWSQGTALANMKVGSLGIGTAASTTAGEIRATNNITAYYSDRRLKTILNVIPDALEKVNSLSGVVYKSNDVAAQYGYTDQSEQIGVIAQEVEAVLPQVVKPAPFDCTTWEDGTETSISGEHYKTVQYEKLVPLLIEAIKELSAQVKDLQQKTS